MRADGPEREVALDMAKLSLVLGPLFIGVAAIVWGLGGVLSSTLALTVVVVNLLFGAWIIGRAAAISPNLLMGAVLSGFILRLIALMVIVMPVRDSSWFEVVPFAIALVGGHLGLLVWESRRASISFAYPGVPPQQTKRLTPARHRSPTSS